MQIHIIRHAEAMDRSSGLPDDYRYLTCRGRTRFRRVAETLRKCGVAPDLIVSSPLVRAVQTAEILAGTLRFSGELTILPALSGGFTMTRLQEYLATLSQVRELALVGHEPDMGLIAGELLDHSPCSIKKGGVVTLKFKHHPPESTVNFLWLITGGGKKIADFDAALTRLSGLRSQPEET